MSKLEKVSAEVLAVAVEIRAPSDVGGHHGVGTAYGK